MLRRIRVYARLALRWFVRYITGRRFTMPITVDVQKVLPILTKRWADAALHLRAREQDNRSLLTGMVVALMTKSTPPFTGWEWYKHAARRRSFSKGVPSRVIGKPVVYKFPLTKIGITEWADDYVPREEQLAARRRLKELKRASA